MDQFICGRLKSPITQWHIHMTVFFIQATDLIYFHMACTRIRHRCLLNLWMKFLTRLFAINVIFYDPVISQLKCLTAGRTIPPLPDVISLVSNVIQCIQFKPHDTHTFQICVSGGLTHASISHILSVWTWSMSDIFRDIFFITDVLAAYMVYNMLRLVPKGLLGLSPISFYNSYY